MSDNEEKPNGTMNGDKPLHEMDPEDPEYQRQMMRPPVIEQDVKEMERRKRVEMIMNSQMFREELEKIIEHQMREGISPGILDFILPQRNRYTGGSMISSSSAMPIADIRGSDSMRYAKGEKLLRCKLASLYRIIDLKNWSQGIYNHITVRINQDTQHFLINPFGLHYDEITASSLLKVDMQGNIIDQGSTNLGISVAGYTLHSAIHEGRPDIRCIIHIHNTSCIAVSAFKEGLLPLSQESALIGEVSYHDYHGILIDSAEKESIVKDLGPVNKVLVLRNHGIVACGETIEEALHLLENVVSSCEAQVKMMPLGVENMVLISEETKKKVYEVGKTVFLNMNKQSSSTGDEDKEQAEPKERQRKWKVGEIEFEAKMRMLDNNGYRTGYVYKQPLVRSDMPRCKNDVEVPPASTSHSHMFNEDDITRYSPLKKFLDGKRVSEKNRWLNSPNVYQKVEVYETGTADPKKITKWVEYESGNSENEKWVQDGSPQHSTPIKIESAHQFVPVGENAKEFKQKQKQIKENRMKSKVTAGPQSNILEGATWEEIKQMQEAQQQNSGGQVVMVGAASKGIIQRDFQHNAVVYKSAYAKNPFDSVTDEDLDEYKRVVEKRQRGESLDDEPVENETVTQEIIIQESRTNMPQSPTSPLSEEEAHPDKLPTKQMPEIVTIDPTVVITTSSDTEDDQFEDQLYGPEAADETRDSLFNRRSKSARHPKKGDNAVNGDDRLRTGDSAGDVSGTSRSSREGSPTKDISASESPKKEKKDKKKKGIRTPSFLKKKKHRKEKEDKEKAQEA